MFGDHKTKKKTAPAKILIVDDEPDCISIIQCRLEWSQYQVITASDGQQGLQKAIDEKPDIILLDTNMPIMNGHEMLERMRKHSSLKDTPVIMVTALCEKRDIMTASNFGIADYITKPVNFPGLLEKISSILEGEISKSLKK